MLLAMVVSLRNWISYWSQNVTSTLCYWALEAGRPNSRLGFMTKVGPSKSGPSKWRTNKWRNLSVKKSTILQQVGLILDCDKSMVYSTLELVYLQALVKNN